MPLYPPCIPRRVLIQAIHHVWEYYLYVVAWMYYNDVIMGTIASQITTVTIVYSTVYSDADERKHKSSASLAFVWGIHRGPVNSPHEWPVTRKMFPFDDVIMVFKHLINLLFKASLRIDDTVLAVSNNGFLNTKYFCFSKFVINSVEVTTHLLILRVIRRYNHGPVFFLTGEYHSQRETAFRMQRHLSLTQTWFGHR